MFQEAIRFYNLGTFPLRSFLRLADGAWPYVERTLFRVPVSATQARPANHPGHRLAKGGVFGLFDLRSRQ